VEDTLLWALKSSLLGCVAQKLQGSLKRSVFGNIAPTALEVNLGVLPKEKPNILLYGHFSPFLKQKIADAAKGKKAMKRTILVFLSGFMLLSAGCVIAVVDGLPVRLTGPRAHSTGAWT
jgi:hydroxylamine reductase (hybrid-cluster protein)